MTILDPLAATTRIEQQRSGERRGRDSRCARRRCGRKEGHRDSPNDLGAAPLKGEMRGQVNVLSRGFAWPAFGDWRVAVVLEGDSRVRWGYQVLSFGGMSGAPTLWRPAWCALAGLRIRACALTRSRVWRRVL